MQHGLARRQRFKRVRLSLFSPSRLCRRALRCILLYHCRRRDLVRAARNVCAGSACACVRMRSMCSGAPVLRCVGVWVHVCRCVWVAACVQLLPRRTRRARRQGAHVCMVRRRCAPRPRPRAGPSIPSTACVRARAARRSACANTNGRLRAAVSADAARALLRKRRRRRAGLLPRVPLVHRRRSAGMPGAVPRGFRPSTLRDAPKRTAYRKARRALKSIFGTAISTCVRRDALPHLVLCCGAEHAAPRLRHAATCCRACRATGRERRPDVPARARIQAR